MYGARGFAEVFPMMFPLDFPCTGVFAGEIRRY
jgi:hypothetical protein